MNTKSNLPDCNLTDAELIEVARSRLITLVCRSHKPIDKMPVLDINDPITRAARDIADYTQLSRRGKRWWLLHRFSHEIMNDIHVAGQKHAMDELLDRIGGLVDVSEPITQHKEGAIAALQAVHNLSESLLKNAEQPYDYPY